MRRVILHIDFDSFFASVEQQDNPLLRGKPIGVTAQNGRNCIIAASVQAKQKGIKSPSQTFAARKICPEIVFVPAHFVLYWEVSQRFIKICKDYSPTVEIFSIDEVFMDVTLTAPLFGGVAKLIAMIKKRIWEEIGEYITASVGISHNKLLAKLASGMQKPNGITEIKENEIIRVYSKIKLTDFCGIGYRIAQRLYAMGITTPLKLRLAPLPALISEFGEVEGKILKDIGMAHDLSPVIPDTQREEVKSVGRQYCLPHNEYDKRIVLQNIYELCEEIAKKLRRLGKKARSVGIYLGGDKSISGRQTLTYGADTGRELFEMCLSLLVKTPCHPGVAKTTIGSFGIDFITSPLFNRGSLQNDIHYVRQISIWTGNLQDADTLPQPLLIEDQKQQKLAHIIDQINAKHGNHTIRNGFLLYADRLTTVPNGYAASIR
ncbi:MAG: DNA polymerase IV [Patescibacteria group bacterium]